MYIDDILSFNKEDLEAEVRVSDGCYTLISYAYPVDRISVKQRVDTLFGFGCSNISKNNKTECAIEKLPQYYAYLLTAQVIDCESRIVRVGELIIDLDMPIPTDIVNGDYVTFSVIRLDCEL